MSSFDIVDLVPPPIIIDSDTPIFSGLRISASDDMHAVRIEGDMNVSGNVNFGESLNVSDHFYCYNASMMNASFMVDVNVCGTMSSTNARCFDLTVDNNFSVSESIEAYNACFTYVTIDDELNVSELLTCYNACFTDLSVDDELSTSMLYAVNACVTDINVSDHITAYLVKTNNLVVINDIDVNGCITCVNACLTHGTFTGNVNVDTNLKSGYGTFLNNVSMEGNLYVSNRVNALSAEIGDVSISNDLEVTNWVKAVNASFTDITVLDNILVEDSIFSQNASFINITAETITATNTCCVDLLITDDIVIADYLSVDSISFNTGLVNVMNISTANIYDCNFTNFQIIEGDLNVCGVLRAVNASFNNLEVFQNYDVENLNACNTVTGVNASFYNINASQIVTVDNYIYLNGSMNTSFTIQSKDLLSINMSSVNACLTDVTVLDEVNVCGILTCVQACFTGVGVERNLNVSETFMAYNASFIESVVINKDLNVSEHVEATSMYLDTLAVSDTLSVSDTLISLYINASEQLSSYNACFNFVSVNNYLSSSEITASHIEAITASYTYVTTEQTVSGRHMYALNACFSDITITDDMTVQDTITCFNCTSTNRMTTMNASVIQDITARNQTITGVIEAPYGSFVNVSLTNDLIVEDVCAAKNINVSTLNAVNCTVSGDTALQGSILCRGLSNTIPTEWGTLYIGNGTLNGVSASIVGFIPPP